MIEKTIDYLYKHSREINLKEGNKAIVYVDGSSINNPGPMGIGCVFKIDDFEFKKKLELANGTNNIAEHLSLLYALFLLNKYKINEVIIYTDSLLLQKQISKEWKIKNENLQKIAKRSFEEIIKIKNFKIFWIKREENKKADELSKIKPIKKYKIFKK